MELYDKAYQFAKLVLCEFECGDSTRKATKQAIEDADGRREQNPISEIGSYVYAAYDNRRQLLYVGETERSIKKRFIGHGSGAHNKKPWYTDMEFVKYKKLDQSEENYRKLHYCPKKVGA